VIIFSAPLSGLLCLLACWAGGSEARREVGGEGFYVVIFSVG